MNVSPKSTHLHTSKHRQSEDLDHAIINAVPDLLFRIDKSGVILDYKTPSDSLLYAPPEQFLGKRLNEIFSEDISRTAMLAIEHALLQHTVQMFEIQLPLKEGIRFFEDRVVPLSDTEALFIVRDITDRKRAEENTVRLAAIVQSSDDAIIAKDLDGTITSWNKGAEMMYGYSETEATGQPISMIIPSSTVEEMVHLLDEIRLGRHIDHYETKRRKKDGTIIDVSLTISPIKDSTGKITAASTIARNITERKQAERELSTTKELMERMFSSIHVLVAYLDSNFNFIKVNAAYAKADGHPEEFFIGKNHFVLYPNKENEETFRRVVQTGKPAVVSAKPFEYPEHPEWGVSYWDWRVEPVRDVQGSVQGVILSLLDVTESKKAEQKIERYRKFFLLSTDAMCIADPFGCFIQVNPAFSKMSGYTEGELISKPFIDFVFPDDRERTVKEMGLQVSTRSSLNFENRYVCKDGTVLLLSWNAFYDKSDGKTYATARDITEHKRAEEAQHANEKRRHQLELELTQAQKLESLGTLASGIAHDFNNILAIIMTHSSLGERMISSPEKILKSLEAIGKASKRGALLVKQLLTFARKTEVVFQSVHVNDLIAEITKLLEETFPKTIVISTHLQAKMPSIVADVTQINQVIMNLCINARDAMPKGGSLSITTSTVDNVALAPKFPHATEREYVLVEITDTGMGMDPEIQQRIFDPFFTTKGPGKGTGLGLALVHSIIKSHNGMIDVTSAPGKGTTFHVYIPIQESRIIMDKPLDEHHVELPRGTETILFIEDEDLLIETVKTLLVTKGYTVLLAQDGDQAVAMFEQHQNKISVVLTDFGLPKFSGDEVIRKILAIKSDAKIILASGFIDPAVKAELVKLGVKSFIQKPYSLSEIERAVRTTIDAV